MDLETCYQNSQGDYVCITKQLCSCNHEQFCSCSKHKYLPKTYEKSEEQSQKDSPGIKENISLNDILEDIYAKSAANVSNPFDLLKKLNKKDKFEMSLGEQREQFKTSLSMKLDNEISSAIPQKIRGKKN